MTDPGNWPYPWKPEHQRGRTPRCSAIHVADTMLTPSTVVWPPAAGRIEPVVKPSISSTRSPASWMAAWPTSRATAPMGRDVRRSMGLTAYPAIADRRPQPARRPRHAATSLSRGRETPSETSSKTTVTGAPIVNGASAPSTMRAINRTPGASVELRLSDRPRDVVPESRQEGVPHDGPRGEPPMARDRHERELGARRQACRAHHDRWVREPSAGLAALDGQYVPRRRGPEPLRARVRQWKRFWYFNHRGGPPVSGYAEDRAVIMPAARGCKQHRGSLHCDSTTVARRQGRTQ